jgi:cysteine-rich repeat protein
VKITRLTLPLLLTTALPALASAPPERVAVETGTILASGEPLDAHRLTAPTPSARTREAWESFVRGEGAGWIGAFDALTGVPLRAWGAGLAAPGAVSSPAAAERHARAFLERHRALLAPGSKAGDLVLVSSRLDAGMRTVGFVQYHQGLRVVGGQVHVRFKKDRLFMFGSEALPDVPVAPSARAVTEGVARQAAGAWIARSLGVTPDVVGFEGRKVLPLRQAEGLTFHDVLEVRVRTTRPAGHYAVYLDATTGEPIARYQRLMFGSGQVAFDVPQRRPGGTRSERGVPGLAVTFPGGSGVTDAQGNLTWTTTQALAVTLGVSGPLVRVLNDAGAEASQTMSLADGGRYVWSGARTEQLDAQLTAFVATQDVKAYVRQFIRDADMPWLAQPLQVTTNINDVCNAFSDGDTINFFRAGMGCENTARLPDVVMHEAGHSIHFHAIQDGVGSFDTSLSEGIADYIAATIQDDPGMGRGFFMSDEPLRHVDPEDGSERVWPINIDRDPHVTGLIIAGALWDLRKALITELGREAGIRRADETWYAIIQRAADIPSSYAEAIALDDDDGNLANGTPHQCLIAAAFGRHGLVDRVNAGPGIGSPTLARDSGEIAFPFMQRDTCPGSTITSAQVVWTDRANPGEGGTIDMVLASGGARYVAVLPRPATPRVYQYRVQIGFDDGASISFPDNPADPLYEVFLGEVVQLYCIDFEDDPQFEGWTHLLEASMPTGMFTPVDDWEWGTPRGLTNSSDPSRAHSGRNAIGNDLGLATTGRVDGRYQGNSTTALLTPTFDTQGYANVHLQYYRWLTVEDGLNDQAKIYGNDQQLWTNLASPMASDPMLQGLVPHLDKEWRFHDVDLSGVVANNQVQAKFQLTANRRRSYGGWTIDDVCVVAFAVCGNGVTEPGEACDDRNTVDGDGCTPTCAVGPIAPVCGNGQLEEGEACDDNNTVDGDGCSATCTIPPPAPRCGDGTVDPGEACDDGVNDGTRCTSTCTTPTPAPIIIDPVDDAGCGCRTQGSSGGATALLWLGLMSALVLRRRAR